MAARAANVTAPGIFADFGEDFLRGMHGANGIVFMGARPAEKRHDAIAGEVGDLAFVAADRGAAGLAISVDQGTKIFGIQFFRKLGRSDQIAEQHRDLADFGFMTGFGFSATATASVVTCVTARTGSLCAGFASIASMALSSRLR